jgi:hypothetical protein
MADDNPSAKDLSDRGRKLSALGASKGGIARANVLTKEQRSAIAREAVRARWIKAGRLKDFVNGPDEAESAEEKSPELPFSMFPGKLKIGDLLLECHVLNDERRVFTQGEMVRALTGGTDSSNLARYLNAKALKGLDLSGGPIRFQIHLR